MRTAYDAVKPQRIPADAQMVLPYVNGLYAWKADDWARFPNAVKVTVEAYIPGQRPRGVGHILDVEAGDVPRCIKEGHDVDFANAREQLGWVPAYYTSKGTWPQLARALSSAGIQVVDWWIADPDNPTPHLIPGTVGTQWGYPGNYDVSTFIDNWPVPAKEQRPMDFPNAVMTKKRPGHPGQCWVLGSDGGIGSYPTEGENACPFFGSIHDIPGPIGDTKFTNFEPHPDGNGYDILGAAGGVYSLPLGSAPHWD